MSDYIRACHILNNKYNNKYSLDKLYFKICPQCYHKIYRLNEYKTLGICSCCSSIYKYETLKLMCSKNLEYVIWISEKFK